MRFYKFLTEKTNSVGIYAGRFQPPHKGHLAVISAMSKENSYAYVFVVAGSKSSTDKERNPISQQDRINLLKSLVPSNITVLGASSAYIPDLVKGLALDTTMKLTIYAGDDRSSDYSRFVNKIKEMGYTVEVSTKNFDRANVSASKVRELLRANDSKEAQKYLPYSVSKIEKWFKI